MQKLALLLCLFLSSAAFAAEPVQVVPERIITAKTALVRAWYPHASKADENGIQLQAERFIRKWKRYEIVQDIQKADISILVNVEPFTVQPGFWQRLAWGMAASQAGTHCSGQTYGQQTQVNCYNTPAPAPLMPNEILAGSIMIFDGEDARQMRISADPIYVQLAEPRGRMPLMSAGKKLRRAIDEATKGRSR